MTDFRHNSWGNQQAAFSPMDPSFQWDYPAVQSPKNMLLQRAADFYASLDNSFESMSSSGSDRSYRASPDRRISSTGSVVAQVKSSIPDKIERRREQNRSSQRAYRERKERHQKELEEQITQWQHKHQLLSRSYSEQSDEVARLKAQIEQLNSEISNLHTGLPSLCGSLCQSPQEFDLVPFFNNDISSAQSTPRLSHAYPPRR
ncbi:uncharacterized protein A1O9_11192 [Exophiala aquamarina CBS 119918]|uniref:BZIP domain-containing protein n=1 Tax=Exophiala aquamarina CBS 119918 TaxID=1182545 RepID=A0A072PB65_9EURO|nr:uncharacterized protein A1O9_11192 [Exophiala aquamarina CBS 119918]KEF52775.1 hypothetical protein A1O9_11192 [Exophiala aquamarina CBS 119918]